MARIILNFKQKTMAGKVSIIPIAETGSHDRVAERNLMLKIAKILEELWGIEFVNRTDPDRKPKGQTPS